MEQQTATQTAETTAAPAKPVFVPQSDKLTQLRNDAKAAWKAQLQFDDPFSKEAKDAKLAFLKIEGEIKAEESALIKAENERIAAEAKNERIKLVSNLLDAHKAFITAAKNTPADKLAELENAFKSASEIVTNELLVKYGGSRPATIKADGEAKGGRDTESKAAILDAARSGKSHKDIETMGYARSTVWHTINNAKKAGETFPNA